MSETNTHKTKENQMEKNLTKTEEIGNYIIKHNASIEKWEMFRKVGDREMFMSRSLFRVPLMVAAKKLSER